MLQRLPFTVQPIAIFVLGIDIQYIHVYQIGLIDRRTPAVKSVEPHAQRGRADKHAPHHVEALTALQMCLVPGDGAGQGLVRINHQQG